MRKLPALFVVFYFLLNYCTAADYVYNYDENCSKAYQAYTSLRLNDGNAAIRQAIKEDPYNLMATFIADYEDCMLLLFNGDAADLEQRRFHKDARLDMLDRGNSTSPWYRLCKAGIYLHWTLIHARFSENLKAAACLRKSYILLKENRKLYPSFDYNNIFFGLEETVIGTVPDDYKWVAAIFGMKGSVKGGISKIDDFLKVHGQHDLLRSEAVLYACYLKFYLLYQQEDVWKFISSSQYPMQGNLLYQFFKANIALNYRKADIALQTLKAAAGEPEYKRYPVLEYETGAALFHKVDPATITYMQSFVTKFRGKIFIKEAWQKMAYFYYLQHNMQQAEFCRKEIAKHGSGQVDADKQAQRFSEGGTWPDKNLLLARLLTDGGYYTQALAKIKDLTETSFNTVGDKLEYNFRLARIYDELNDDDKAVAYYRAAITIGRGRKEHFAARAALQTAFIYERKNNVHDAVSMYNECLNMKGHDFQNSIDQQAKAGLNRLSAN